MKRFGVALVFTFMILSFLAACATTDSKRGSGGKKTTPQQAQEEVVEQPSPARGK